MPAARVRTVQGSCWPCKKRRGIWGCVQLCRTARALEDFPPKHQGRDEKVLAIAVTITIAFAFAIQITVTPPIPTQISVPVAVAVVVSVTVTMLVAIVDDPTQPF
ncbi:hypothetical protein PV10_04643 [Exophiala mesophila]|uniref:Uncharacterized protein n=1 Tax=Exophiala mesophila TaxID=212818 RepID=A0A0D1WVP0_EXOME|nr:uncharacterized protein PV10_04643 [Exophiala mesophila]KIV93430.1 hypothetical protein PV10_04643 [Exophiala mesophila]